MNTAPDTMKAVVNTSYGPPDVLQLKQVDTPVPGEKEVLIRVKATAVNSADWRLRKADPFVVRFFFGLLKPKKNILGGVFSGQIQKTGKDVTLFKTGDQVFGSAAMRFGAYAEYLCLPESGTFAIKPENISHEEAAAIPFGGTTALYFIRKANIQSGQRVLVYGASGAVGTAAVQLAKYFEANVTAVCSTANVDMVKFIGADTVIDYTKEDFTKNGLKYDVIIETVNKASFAGCIGSLQKEGILILSASGMGDMLRGLWTSMTSSRKVITGVIKETAADILFLKGLIEAGKFRPVVDKVFPLEQMAEAHRYVEGGHKRGNVAVVVAD